MKEIEALRRLLTKLPSPYPTEQCGHHESVNAVLEEVTDAINRLIAQYEAGMFADAAGASEGQAEPVAWLHTMHMEGGQTDERLSFSDENPWGEPGLNYSEEYAVVSKPLVHPSAEITAPNPDEEFCKAYAEEWQDTLKEQSDCIKERDAEIAALRERIAGMEKDAADGEAEFLHPATQVFFRAGLLACREYMARFVEHESPTIAASIRANWWPSIGQDFGAPRKLDWNELTVGEYGDDGFRAKTADEVSPTQEALPIALQFLLSLDPGNARGRVTLGREGIERSMIEGAMKEPKQ